MWRILWNILNCLSFPRSKYYCAVATNNFVSLSIQTNKYSQAEVNENHYPLAPLTSLWEANFFSYIFLIVTRRAMILAYLFNPSTYKHKNTYMTQKKTNSDCFFGTKIVLYISKHINGNHFWKETSPLLITPWNSNIKYSNRFHTPDIKTGFTHQESLYRSTTDFIFRGILSN